jgi:ribonuclease BN (tRNA processing enzyme)
MLTFIPLGVGDAFSKLYYSSSLLVSADGATLLVDCPHPIRKMLYEVAVDPKPNVGDVDAVVLTHLHADHVSGLEGFLFYSRYHLNRLGMIVAHDTVLSELWPHHLAAGMGNLQATDPGERRSLDAYATTSALCDDRPIRVGPFEIRCRRTIHNVPTYALKISACGATLGYSADTSFDPTLIEWLSDSTLIIHETNDGIHTPYEELNALPKSIKNRVRLIHYPDDFDVDSSAIECLVQGRRYGVYKKT